MTNDEKKKNLKAGQVLEFDVYGTKITGEFIVISEGHYGVIDIKTIKDDSGVFETGEVQKINIDHLLPNTK
jgi:hypothetical protein